MKPEQIICQAVEQCYDLLGAYGPEKYILEAGKQSIIFRKLSNKKKFSAGALDNLLGDLDSALLLYGKSGAPIEKLPAILQETYFNLLQQQNDARGTGKDWEDGRLYGSLIPAKDNRIMGGLSAAAVALNPEKYLEEIEEEDAPGIFGKTWKYLAGKWDRFATNYPRTAEATKDAVIIGVSTLPATAPALGGLLGDLQDAAEKSKQTLEEIAAKISPIGSAKGETSGRGSGEVQVKICETPLVYERDPLEEIIEDAFNYENIISGEFLNHYFIDSDVDVEIYNMSPSDIHSVELKLGLKGGNSAYNENVPQKVVLIKTGGKDSAKYAGQVRCFTLKKYYRDKMVAAFDGGSDILVEAMKYIDVAPDVPIEGVWINGKFYDITDMNLRGDKELMRHSSGFELSSYLNPAWMGWLTIALGSPADLEVSATEAGLTGYYPINNWPDIIYSGKNSEPEFVVIPAEKDDARLRLSNYKITVKGQSAGNFDLRVSKVLCYRPIGGYDPLTPHLVSDFKFKDAAISAGKDYVFVPYINQDNKLAMKFEGDINNDGSLEKLTIENGKRGADYGFGQPSPWNTWPYFCAGGIFVGVLGGGYYMVRTNQAKAAEEARRKKIKKVRKIEPELPEDDSLGRTEEE